MRPVRRYCFNRYSYPLSANAPTETSAIVRSDIQIQFVSSQEIKWNGIESVLLSGSPVNVVHIVG